MRANIYSLIRSITGTSNPMFRNVDWETTIRAIVENSPEGRLRSMTQERDTLSIRCNSLSSDNTALAEQLERRTSELEEKCNEKKALAKELEQKTVKVEEQCQCLRSLSSEKDALKQMICELEEECGHLRTGNEVLVEELKQKVEDLNRFMRRGGVGLGGRQGLVSELGVEESEISRTSRKPISDASYVQRNNRQQELLANIKGCWMQFNKVLNDIQLETEELCRERALLGTEEREINEELRDLAGEREEVLREVTVLRDRERDLEGQLEELKKKPARTQMSDGIPSRERRLERMLEEVRRGRAEREGWLGAAGEEGQSGHDDQGVVPQGKRLTDILDGKIKDGQILAAKQNQIICQSEVLQALEAEVYRALLAVTRALDDDDVQ